MMVNPKKISPLFLNEFEVDSRLPFERHLNRLEVEIGQEDYSHLKRVQLLEETPSPEQFAKMTEITGRLLENTQNAYNRNLLQNLKVRIYLDREDYSVYYRLPDRCLRFEPIWRKKVLQRFFQSVPSADTGWHSCKNALPGFESRFLPDEAGGICLLRKQDQVIDQPALITASHGPYDPHTLEVTLYFLRSGKGDAAAINLGFSGREPLNDQCLEKLANWGIPINPSNIDVIYPYLDQHGHPYCYKLEEGLAACVETLGIAEPELVIDIHGCVGTFPEDNRVIIGLGGMPPFHTPEDFGEFFSRAQTLHLLPAGTIRKGLFLLRELSSEMFVQLCADRYRCYNFALLGGMQLIGSEVDPRRDVASLMKGEERSYLPGPNLRWLPGASANALQRLSARKINPDVCCLHVEIPTAVRRKVALKLHEQEIGESLASSGL